MSLNREGDKDNKMITMVMIVMVIMQIVVIEDVNNKKNSTEAVAMIYECHLICI